MSLATKLQVITWKEQGKSWEWMGQQLEDAYSRATLRSAYRNRASIRARVAAGAPEMSRSAKQSQFPEVDSRLYDWFLSVPTHGRKRVPLSLAVLRATAEQIATSLGITAFSASNGFLQNCARRHKLVNVALHGSGASASVEEAAARMAEIRRQLEGVDPDLIYNVDETGLLYRCLPSRSYVPSADRRRARGSKVMHSKDRVTLTLCCNATGFHKLPITMIGRAAQPLCFNGAGNRCPIPYFSQKSAWTDGKIFKRWFVEVFVPSLRSRTASHVCLILDNLSCHTEIHHPQVTVIELPPNTTAIYQPLDKGAIAQVKRQYKTRLVQCVVNNVDGVISLGGVAPRVPRGRGLDQGGQAHLRDAAHIIAEEWEKVSTVHLANFWLTADVLHDEAAAEVRRQLHGVVPVADNVHTDVSEVVALMATSGLADEFVGVSESERSRAVEQWFAAEDDAKAVDETVDMVLNDGEEESEE